MADNAAFPARLRTYGVMANAIADCTIWEAARATSAAPSFFKPALIKDEHGLETRYLDGGLKCNNPTKELLAEAAERFPGRRVACLLSLGTGQKSTIQLPKAGGIPKLQLLKVVKLLQKIATDCEDTHQQLAKRFLARPGLSGVYFRFNVEQGMQGVGLEEWKRLSEIRAHTSNYTRRHPCNQDIDRAVTAISDRQGLVTIEQAAALL
jgi:patatin-like phospholipase/acyl hydrolase